MKIVVHGESNEADPCPEISHGRSIWQCKSRDRREVKPCSI